jgi:hypothetical protein
VRHPATETAKAATPQPIGKSVKPKRMKTGVRENDIESRTRSGIFRLNGSDVFANVCEHEH